MIVRWLLSKWLYFVVIAGAVTFLGGVYQAGYNAAWRKAEGETKQAEIDTLKQDLAIQRGQREAAEYVNDLLERKDEANAVALEEAARILASRPDDAGRGLTQLELDGLLNIK